MSYFRFMLFKRVLVFSMMFILLFADSGQMIYAHTCLKSKHTHISISRPKHCCSSSKAINSCSLQKTRCCEVTSKYIKQSFPNDTFEIREIKQTPAVVAITELFELFYSSPVATANSFHSPPLPSGKDVILFTQVFRI